MPTTKPSVSMTVDVYPKQVTVTTTRENGHSVEYTMKKTEPGMWKGTVKADVTTKAIEDLFPDEDPEEIEDIIDDLSSRGMDMHRQLLLDE